MNCGPNQTNDFNFFGKICFKILLKFTTNPKNDTLLLMIGKSINGIKVFKGDGE